MENNEILTGVDNTLEGVKKLSNQLKELGKVVTGMSEGLSQIEEGLSIISKSKGNKAGEITKVPAVLDSEKLVESIVSGVTENLLGVEEGSVKLMDILLSESNDDLFEERLEKPTYRGNVNALEEVEDEIVEENTPTAIEEVVEEVKESENEDSGFKVITATLIDLPDDEEESEEPSEEEAKVLEEIANADDMEATEVYGVALDDLRVSDLGEVLRELDLPVSGKKQALVDRVLIAYKSEEFTEEEMKNALQVGLESNGADVEAFEELENTELKEEIENDLVEEEIENDFIVAEEIVGEHELEKIKVDGIEFNGRVLDRATWLEVLDSLFEGVTDDLTDEDIIDNLRVADEEGMLNWEEEAKEDTQEEEYATFSNERESKEIDVYNSVIEDFNNGKIKITEVKTQIDKYYDGDPTAKKAKDLTTEELVQTLAEINAKLVDDEAEVHGLEDVYIRDGKWMCCGRELKQSKENENEMFCEICGIVYEF